MKGKETSEKFYKHLSDDEKLYVIERLDDQIVWYDNKSQNSKKNFQLFRVVIIICAALIPITSSLPYFKDSATFLGVIIIVIEGLSSLFKFQEHWIEYRQICETLQHEKFMYLYKSGIYEDDSGSFSYFVERIESIISQENLNWASLNNTTTKEN